MRTLEDNLKLFDDYRRLAIFLVNKYRTPKDNSINRQDMDQVAYTALWESCLTFDESKGVKFLTYAGDMINFRLMTMLRDTESMRTPRYFKLFRTAVAKRDFAYPLTDEEELIILEDTGLSRYQLDNYLNYSMTSIDTPLSYNTEYTLSDIIEDTSISESDRDLQDLIDILISYLEDDLKPILTDWLRSLACDEKVLTQKDLADKYNYSQPKVCRIQNKFLKRMKVHRNEILDLVC